MNNPRLRAFIKSLVPLDLQPVLTRLFHWNHFTNETISPVSSQAAPPFVDPVSNKDSVWVFIDHPQAEQVLIETGVLSIRGWAWSKEHGRGRLWISVEGDQGTVRTIPIRHRFVRVDVHTVYPEIPLDNFAGFEISVDRFDLPEKSRVSLYFGIGDTEKHVRKFEVLASHAHRIDGTIKIPCNTCGGQEWVPIGRKDNLTLVRCKTCGLIFTNPRPDPEIIHARYSPDYFEEEYLKGILDNFSIHETHWNNILNEVERFRMVSPYLFEVGTGAGFALSLANKRGWKASGIDLNEKAVMYARNQLGLDVNLGDISRWQFPDIKYGAILLESTLEHFEDPAQVIAKCARALHPGGGLFIWTLTSEGEVFKDRGLDYHFIGPSEHLYYFTAGNLCQMCERVGLRVDSVWREALFDSIALIATCRSELYEVSGTIQGFGFMEYIRHVMRKLRR